MKRCSVCLQECKFGTFVPIECGHVTHYKCKGVDDRDFEKCNDCRGETTKKLPIKEDMSYNGHDYIREPYGDTKVNPNVEKLFANHQTSIEAIVLGEGLHLQKLLHYGINIETFLKNGYTWEDLIKFNDLSEPGERRIDALFALKCNAEHFRDYANELPVKELGITGMDMVQAFGLHWKDNKTSQLEVLGGKNMKQWTMEDLNALGVDATVLYKAGLETLAQFNALDPSSATLVGRMGFTQEHIDDLWPPKEREQPRVVYRPPSPPIRRKEGSLDVFGSSLYVGRKRHGLKK